MDVLEAGWYVSCSSRCVCSPWLSLPLFLSLWKGFTRIYIISEYTSSADLLSVFIMYLSLCLFIFIHVYICIHVYVYTDMSIYTWKERGGGRTEISFRTTCLIAASMFCLQNKKQINFKDSFQAGWFLN